MRFRATLSSVPTDLALRLLPHSNTAERRHEYTIGSYRGRPRSRILYRMKAAGLCVLMLAGLGAGSAQFAAAGGWSTRAPNVSRSRTPAACGAPPARRANPAALAPHPSSHTPAARAPL